MENIFYTKKQVVKVGDMYAARYKKWWQSDWRYIGINSSWSKNYIHEDFILSITPELAYRKLKKWFPEIIIINNY